jgi:hypothetical protein
MQTGFCELYRPSDVSRTRPTCEAATILSELFDLLEEYAPEWYTQEHHDALQATLEKMSRMKS